MTFEELAKLAEAEGFSAWASLDISTLSLKPDVRDMCGACRMYGSRWSCPPGCGSLQQCAENIQKYSRGILVQTVGDLEDGFDFEAMQKIEADHKARFARMYLALTEKGIPHLALGAGCCTVCGECTYPDNPCRFPDRMVSSMEAYGILVHEVCRANDLKYYYGSGKMAYTGCYLV